MSDNVHKLPEPGVILDLDAAERPGVVKAPFIAKLGDRNVTLLDPSDIDWRDLAAVDAPQDLIRVAMSREDLEYMRDLALPTWKFNKLLEAYSTYYDLEEKLRNARRQAQFAGI